jgi:hypothetical protein
VFAVDADEVIDAVRVHVERLEAALIWARGDNAGMRTRLRVDGKATPSKLPRTTRATHPSTKAKRSKSARTTRTKPREKASSRKGARRV